MRRADPAALATNLLEPEPGRWLARGGDAVSYPESGHDTLFEIEDRSWWFRHRSACIVAAVRRSPPVGTIVEIGGGNGVVSAALSAAGFSTLLVEPGAAGIRNARRRGLEPVIQASFHAAGLRPGSLPAIGLFDVLEHLPDDTAFLRDLRTALAPDGHLYLTVPAHRVLWSPEDVAAGHQRRYGTRMLRRRLGAAGFQVEKMTQIFWPLPLPILLARSLAARIGWREDRGAAARTAEYVAPGPLVELLVRAALAPERALVARGWGSPLGSSLLAVARPAAPGNVRAAPSP